MAVDIPGNKKSGERKVVVGGLSLLFKDECDGEPKTKDFESSRTIIGAEENMVVVDGFPLACKDNDQAQKEVNCSSSIIMVEEVEESVADDKKPVGLNMEKNGKRTSDYTFKMPLHFPRYTKEQYEEMSEEKLDLLLQEYGLFVNHGDLDYKKQFAINAFLWPTTTPCGELLAAQNYQTACQEKRK
ncbi:hypothetical protein RCOM_1481440 [Ricinus communis]|uniref:DUF7722 domain-containing protein n=1 Tax=Ricinus communis TaxID=3988 RepID=B9SE00_RICCO|nr:hypothetical protein RCOM_1481440 [Ricinus communis]|eukprot:XP_015577900.1 uncharacterized protein LOC8287467 [Ricinus communis]